jgi:thiopeptide-type bacteriocin biosynthesis protein
MSGVPTAWISFHLFYHSAQETLIAEGIAPTVEALRARGAIDRFFFLRYWNGGPHLRLRFHPAPTADAAALAADIEAQLTALVRDRPSAQSLAAEDYVRVSPYLSAAESMPLETFAGDNRVERRTYEPELQKYGAGAGIAFAEDVFDASTRVALGLVRPGTSRRESLGAALTAALAGLAALGFDRAAAADFFADYSEFWAGHVRAVSGKAEKEPDVGANPGLTQAAASILEGRRVPPALARWRDLLASLRSRLGLRASDAGDERRLRRLLTNFFHTHNNRLGLLVGDEALMGALGRSALADAEAVS